MLNFLKSTVLSFRSSWSLSSITSDVRKEHMLMLIERKQRLLAIVHCVQGTALRFHSHINHASDMGQLDMVQADLFTFLARDRGEKYARSVISGTVEAQPSGYVPLNLDH